MNVDQIKLTLDSLGHALSRIDEALSEPLDNPLAIDATIQRFEFTIELFWKALKRSLEHEGVEATTPRTVLQQAYQAGWPENEDAWLQMLRKAGARAGARGTGWGTGGTCASSRNHERSVLGSAWLLA